MLPYFCLLELTSAVQIGPGFAFAKATSLEIPGHTAGQHQLGTSAKGHGGGAGHQILHFVQGCTKDLILPLSCKVRITQHLKPA